MTPLLTPVRPLQRDPELDAFYRMATVAFLETDDVEATSASFRRFDETRPGFHPSQRRGYVVDGEIMGGYVMHERTMCMGPARLSTACIAAVVTDSKHRLRGIGRALMEDAIQHAVHRTHAILLLDGIGGFYHRFGYTDVLDETVHSIRSNVIPREPPEGVHVRPATVADAPALLDLYRRHQGRNAGSFDWNQEHMRHEVALRIEIGEAPVVVQGPDGILRGYLYANDGSGRAFEVGADTWPAALALLQQQAPHAASHNGTTQLQWSMPHDAPTLYLLDAHLDMPAREMGGGRIFAIRSETRRQRNEGWMARPAHMETLLRSLLPLWQERWSRAVGVKPEPIRLCIDDRGFLLTLDRTVEITPHDVPEADIVLDSTALTQLVFGYRPAWWVAAQGHTVVPSALLPMLEILFPAGGFWVAGTDAF